MSGEIRQIDWRIAQNNCQCTRKIEKTGYLRRYYAYNNIVHRIDPVTIRWLACLAIQPQLGLQGIWTDWLLALDPDCGTAAWLVLTEDKVLFHQDRGLHSKHLDLDGY